MRQNVRSLHRYRGATPVRSRTDTIRNEHLELVLHPDGGLARLTEVVTGRPVLGSRPRSAILAARIDGVRFPLALEPWQLRTLLLERTRQSRLRSGGPPET